ncbi:hypothetical protein B0H21DRAFT_136541 [Amylocystis lapponica]|nr:hypothetical protein B0H21DRAFT_136541 [Amylocystis lapponica]
MVSMVDDHQQPLAQAQHPHHTSTLLSLQDMEQYQQWARIAPSYPFHTAPTHLDAQSSPYSEEPLMPPPMIANRRLPVDSTATRHFLSTLQQQQPRRSPQTHTQQQRILASDLSPDQTMMGHVTEEMLAAHLATVGAASTSTGATLGPNLDGSPSWNSAMTQMQVEQQLDHLYRYQAQQARNSAVAMSRGQPHPDSSRLHRNSHSSIGPAPLPNLPPAHQYSHALHQQQQQQLRRQQERLRQQVAEEKEQARRHSEEEEYLRQLAEAYGSNSAHPQEALSDGPQYFPEQGYLDGALMSPQQEDGEAEEAYRRHAAGMLEGYHPLDGPDPLDMVGVQEEGSPMGGMIKYESPLQSE